MIECNKCGYINLDGTCYCQTCGKELDVKIFHPGDNLKFLAGYGMRDFSAAPIFAMKIDEQAEQLDTNYSNSITKVRVRPLRDGSWFCPDCGFHNETYSISCSSCGRDI